MQSASADKGISITVFGTGFSTAERVQIEYDSKLIDTITTNKLGGFESVFTALPGQVKEHRVAAKGNIGSFTSAEIVMEKIILTAPQLVSPSTKAELVIFNSLLDVFANGFKYLTGGLRMLSETKFSWSGDNIASDISYIFQIAQETTFTSPVIQKEQLKHPEYILAADDNLKTGYYYWRVKTRDAIGNESDWSGIYELKIDVMPLRVMIFFISTVILSIALVVLLVIIVSYLIKRRAYW